MFKYPFPYTTHTTQLASGQAVCTTQGPASPNVLSSLLGAAPKNAVRRGGFNSSVCRRRGWGGGGTEGLRGGGGGG